MMGSILKIRMLSYPLALAQECVLVSVSIAAGALLLWQMYSFSFIVSNNNMITIILFVHILLAKIVIIIIDLAQNDIFNYYIGRRVAELELHIAIAQILKSFNVGYSTGPDTKMDFILKGILIPEKQMDLVFSDF